MMFQLIISDGLPQSLQSDQDLILSVILNLFSLSLERNERCYIYVILSYDYKQQMLKINIDEKAINQDHRSRKRENKYERRQMKKDPSVSQTGAFFKQQNNINQFQCIEFQEGQCLIKHSQLILKMISEMAKQNRGYFYIKETQNMGQNFEFAIKALEVNKALSCDDQL